MVKMKYNFAVFVLNLILLIGIVSAADPGHGAASVSAGTFEAGNFVFPNNLTVNENIGIGTSSPLALLDLNHSNANQDKLIWVDASSYRAKLTKSAGNIGLIQLEGANSYFGFQTRNAYNSGSFADTLAITTTGSVGIGTNNPQSILHLNASNANSILTLENVGNGYSSGINFVRQRSTGNGVIGGSIFLKSNTTGTDAKLFIQAQSASADATNDNPLTGGNGARLVLYGGRGVAYFDNTSLGIGNQAPGYALDVNGIVNASGYLVNGSALATGSNVSGSYVPYTGALNNVNLGVYNLTTTGRIGVGTGASLYQLEVSATNKALNVSGNLYVNSTSIGIGTANPRSILEINSTASATYRLLVTNTSGYRLFSIDNSGNVVFSDQIPTINFANANTIGFNDIDIADPGAGEGFGWTGTSAGWVLDVSPRDRSNNDGNLNIYGTANNISLWRPVNFLYNASIFGTINTQASGVLNISGISNVSFSGAILNNIGTPLAATDAATKGYVDALNTSAGTNGTSTYVPYNGASKNINLGIYNLTTSGFVGLNTTNLTHLLSVNGRARINAESLSVYGGYVAAESSTDNLAYPVSWGTYAYVSDNGFVNVSNPDNAINIRNYTITALTGVARASKIVPAYPGQTYAVQMVMKTTGSGSLYVSANKPYPEGGNTISVTESSTFDEDLGNGWHRVSKTVTVVSNTVNQAILQFGISGGAISDIFYVYNLQWENGTAVSAYTEQPRLRGDLVVAGRLMSLGINSSYFAGNVGIGTANPAYNLEVSAQNKALNVSNNLYVNSTSVGIGNSNPSYALDVNGIVNASGFMVNGSYLTTGSNASSTYVPYTGAIQNVNLGVWNLTTTGRVGIGTTKPALTLDVNGSNNAIGVSQSGYSWSAGGQVIGAEFASWDSTRTNAAGTYYYRWTGTATNYGTGYIGQEGDGSGNYGLAFKTNNTSTKTYATETRLFITPSGNIGIGTLKPTAALDVNGIVNASGFMVNGSYLTTGSNASSTYVPYTGATQNVNLGSKNLSTTGFIGAGIASPTNPLEVVLNGGITPGNATTITHLTQGGNGGPILNFRVEDGGTAVDGNGETLGRIAGYGSYAANAYVEGARIDLVPEGPFNATSAPSYITLSTSAMNSVVPSERFRITSNGSVGIGTTSPAYKIDVNGTAHFVGNVTVSSWITNLSTPLALTDAATKGYVDTAISGANSSLALGDDWNLSSNVIYPKDLLYNVSIGGTSAKYKLEVSASNRALNVSANLYVNSTNIGIGTPNPSALLHSSSSTSGDSVFKLESDTDNNNENDNPWIHFTQDSGLVNAFIGLAGDGGTAFGQTVTDGVMNALIIHANNTDSASYLQLATNNSARLTVTPNGLVGIGTTTPSRALDVRGVGNFSGTVYINNGTDISALYNNASYLSTYNTTYHSYTVGQNATLWSAINAKQTTANTTATYVPYVGASKNTILGNNNLSIGLGRTTPAATLDINGSFAAITYSADAGVPGTSYYSTGKNGFLLGTLDMFGNITASGQGAFAQGFSTAYTQGNGSLVASGYGSFAQGVVSANVDDIFFTGNGRARLTASGSGSFAQGASFGNGGAGISDLTASGIGSSAQGAAVGYLVVSNITASGIGSSAQGYAYNGNITSSGSGSFAQGAALGGNVVSSGVGSFVFGNASSSSGNYGIVFGQGIANTISNSFSVGFGNIGTTPTLFVNGTAAGVGTTAPMHTLEVKGTFNVSNTNGGARLTSAGDFVIGI